MFRLRKYGSLAVAGGVIAVYISLATHDANGPEFLWLGHLWFKIKAQPDFWLCANIGHRKPAIAGFLCPSSIVTSGLRCQLGHAR